MAFVLMLGIALLGGLIYAFFAMDSVPDAKRERFGEVLPLPADVGQWKEDHESAEAREAEVEGLIREVRYFFHEPQGFGSQGRLVKQVRYRHAESRKITRIDPEQPVDRRRTAG